MSDMTPTVDLGPQARLLTRLAENIGDDRLDDPTPCPELAVRNLLGHLLGLSVAFRDAGRKQFGPTTDTAPDTAVPDIGADWRVALPKYLAELAEVWRDPAAWEGQTRAGGVTMPGAVTGMVVTDELVVHGWDLAVATGQEYAPDTASLEACHALLSQGSPDEGGMFGPVVPVPEEAPLLERVIGLSGRDPRWTPGR